MSELWAIRDSALVKRQRYLKDISDSGKVEFMTQKNIVEVCNNRFSHFAAIYNKPGSIQVSVGKTGNINLSTGDIDKFKAKLGDNFAEQLISVLSGVDEELRVSLYTIIDGDAHIPVVGTLRRGSEIDQYYYKYGSTTYNEIIIATQLADLDSRVTGKIVYDHNGPGGLVDGCDVAGMAIAAATKPTKGVNHYWCFSANYWLISQCDEIVAISPTAEFGSLGVAIEWVDWSEYYKEIGVSVNKLSSKNAPNKRPQTVELQNELYQKSIDSTEDIFISRVSSGRKRAGLKDVSVEYVAQNFGRGGDLIAGDALKVGMVDEVSGESVVIINFNNEGDDMEILKITSAELKAGNGDLYNEIFELGLAKGTENVNSSVSSHLKWVGKAKIETIVDNIKGGKACDNEVTMAYSDEQAAIVLGKDRNGDDNGTTPIGNKEMTPEQIKAGADTGGEDDKGKFISLENLNKSFDKLGM